MKSTKKIIYMSDFLPALESLVRNYLLDITPTYCPLCPIAEKIGQDIKKIDPCEICPWTVLRGKWCEKASYKKDSFPKRIRRIENWIRLIKTKNIRLDAETLKRRK